MTDPAKAAALKAWLTWSLNDGTAIATGPRVRPPARRPESSGPGQGQCDRQQVARAPRQPSASAGRRPAQARVPGESGGARGSAAGRLPLRHSRGSLRRAGAPGAGLHGHLHHGHGAAGLQLRGHLVRHQHNWDPGPGALRGPGLHLRHRRHLGDRPGHRGAAEHGRGPLLHRIRSQAPAQAPSPTRWTCSRRCPASSTACGESSCCSRSSCSRWPTSWPSTWDGSPSSRGRPPGLSYFGAGHHPRHHDHPDHHRAHP